MGEREDMGISGASSFLMHGGFGGIGAFSWQTGLQAPQGIQSFACPSPSMVMQSSDFGGGAVNSTFQGEPSSLILPNFGINMGSQIAAAAPQQEPIKRKRGRPRKYGPDRSAELGLSQNPNTGPGLESDSGCGSQTPTRKRGRGRPPGSGKKQKLASCGEWVSSSGIGFTPHILSVLAGEDVGAKITSFYQQARRCVCVLSAHGSISSATLHNSRDGTLTFEGHYEILSLSGTYVFSEDDESHNEKGGLSVCLFGMDGFFVGGGVGKLIADSQVQIMVGSFIVGDAKSKNKTKLSSRPGAAQEPPVDEDKNNTVSSNAQQPNHDPNPVLTEWPLIQPNGCPPADDDEKNRASSNAQPPNEDPNHVFAGWPSIQPNGCEEPAINMNLTGSFWNCFAPGNSYSEFLRNSSYSDRVKDDLQINIGS